MTLPLSFSTPSAKDHVWSVAQLSASVKRLIEGHPMPLWVRGELVQCKVWSSGHWYFTLRDSHSQVRCRMSAMHASRTGRPPADGTEVYVLAKPALYEEKGEFQLVVSRVLPTSALGSQQQELERVKELLQKDGLFDVTRKRPIPKYPARIALVTSRDGAAIHDVVTVTRKRWPCARLLVISSRVQGDSAVDELVRALRLVNRIPEIDLCIVGRGGGSREDLAAFNTEPVCRALAAVRVPTISAVGHEVDVSLTDLVADLRAATPSAAAELGVPDRREVQRVLDDLSVRLASRLSGRTKLVAERLERIADRLRAGVQSGLDDRRNLIDRMAVQMDALSPLKVLGRGYAVPLGPEGRVLKRVGDFAPGERFQLRVVDGNVPARAE